MSRDGSVDLDLDGSTYRFRLGIGDLEALQEATDIGAAEHLHRLYTGQGYSFRHVRDLIRTALIGGGLGVAEAYALARRFDDMSAVELTSVATLAVAAALEGAEDERLPHRPGKDASVPMPNGKMAFGDFYAAAAAMKLTAADMRAMSLWQFAAYVAGFNRANDPKASDPLSMQEEDAIWDWMNGPVRDAD